MEGWSDKVIQVLQEDFPSPRKPFKVTVVVGGTYMIKEFQIKIKIIKKSVLPLWTEQWRESYVKDRKRWKYGEQRPKTFPRAMCLTLSEE